MTSKRSFLATAAVATALGMTLLAGCAPSATEPTATATSTPSPSATAGTKVPPPASEDEAIEAAQATVTNWFRVWSEIETTGSTDLTPLEAVSSGNALKLAENSIAHIQNGPIPDENGNRVDGPGTVTGGIKFEPTSAYGQEWEGTPNGLVTITACQDITDRVVTTADGTPGQRNESLRNVAEYKVSYDAEKQSWFVTDAIDVQQKC